MADSLSGNDRVLTMTLQKNYAARSGGMGMTLFAHCRAVFAMIAVLILIGAAPVRAQLVDPDGSAVKEQQLLQQLQRIQGRGSIPDTKSYVIEQPAGRMWRAFHEVTMHWIGAIAILGMLALLVLFYLIRGMVRLEGGRSGRTITRFSAFERFVHWMTATCFITLALTGLNITFGKELLLPFLQPETFTDIAQWAKYAHNFLSFPFTLGVILIFLMWIAWNIPSETDVAWLKAGGGIIGHAHPPAKRFNLGQKGIYWIVVLGGGTMATTGYLLMFPFYVTDIAGMQLAQVVHGVVAVLFVAVMIAHIYIGTIGMEGAFEGMGTGEVDVNWAKQHHSLWAEQELAKKRAMPLPPGVAATPAE
jgi:formate dehydrogenase subunit gamma